MPWPPLLTLLFSKKNKWCQVTNTCKTLLMVFVAYCQGWIQGDGIRGMYPPHQPFSKMFLINTMFA